MDFIHLQVILGWQFPLVNHHHQFVFFPNGRSRWSICRVQFDRNCGGWTLIKDVYKGTFTSSAMQLIIKVIKPFNVEKLDIFPTKYTRDFFPQKFFCRPFIGWVSSKSSKSFNTQQKAGQILWKIRNITKSFGGGSYYRANASFLCNTKKNQNMFTV